MHPTKRCFVAALVAGAGALAPVAGRACTLQPMDAVRIKQMMADEIGHRMGLARGKFPLAALTEPRLHSPYPLDSLCAGLGAFHHSAGFRYAQVWRIGPGPFSPAVPRPVGPGPALGAQADALVAGARDAAVGGWPPYATCAYEGVAVVLGYGYTSPVAVHFERRCS